VLQAVNRIITPEPIDHSVEALMVMCIAMACTIGLVIYQRKVIATTGITGGGIGLYPLYSDLTTNMGVVLALSCLRSWAGPWPIP
jgi:divalent metal cation (Fe/Co/Zn/Cd) transporter